MNKDYKSGHNPKRSSFKNKLKRHPKGYLLYYYPHHPNYSCGNKYVPEQVLVVEMVMRKHLPKKTVIHHVNEVKNDNRNNNLVACENEAYHKLLHQRMRALIACGHANWRKCYICKEYDAQDNLHIREKRAPFHKQCLQKIMEKYR